MDAVGAALVGGALTGAGLGAVQWWAAKGALGRAAAWIGSSAVGYAAGLATGAALVGYDTDLGALATMGAVSGLVLGVAQGLALAAQGRKRLAVAWATAMPVLFALGWSATTAGGISVEDQFTVFGAYGAVLFMLLSGLVLARFTRVPHRWRDGRRRGARGARRVGARGQPFRFARASRPPRRHHRSGLHGVDELPEAIRDVHAGRVRGKIVVAT